MVNGLRISPDGQWLAIAEKSIGFGSTWSIVFIDGAGNDRRLDARVAGDYLDMAWAPGVHEIWFNGYQGANPEWQAIDTNGRVRSLLRAPCRCGSWMWPPMAECSPSAATPATASWAIDPVGLMTIDAIQIADDDRTYYYTFHRVLSHLIHYRGSSVGAPEPGNAHRRV